MMESMDCKTVTIAMSDLEILCKNELELKTIRNALQNLTSLMRNENCRSKVSGSDWKVISEVAKSALQIMTKSNFDVDELDFLAELLRFLRNSCAGSSKNQHFILCTSEICNCADKVISKFMQSESDREVAVLKCCVQFYGNLVSSGNDAKSFVWSLFLEKNAFKYLLENKDLKVHEYTMMVLYNCMSEENSRNIISTYKGHEILIALTNSLCNNMVDWGVILLECLMQQEDFMECSYNILPVRSRLLLLDVMAEQLDNIQDINYSSVPTKSVRYIKDLFVEYAMDIVHVCNSEITDMKPIEIVKMLTVLCAASIPVAFSSLLKASKDLLEICLDTLKCIHLLGKKSCNEFSCISSLKVADSVAKEEIESHPSFCFKKNLIRLIGNLCCNCQENQDLVRKLDGIPLLLDCCNLDVRNPFIMQWCIFAIRNVLEKNAENQAVLASISVTGDLVDSPLLNELGFEVCCENEKVVLRTKQCP